MPRAAEMPTRRSGSDPTAMNVTAQSRCECLYSPPFKHGETPCVDSWVWVTCGDMMTLILSLYSMTCLEIRIDSQPDVHLVAHVWNTLW